MTIKNKLLAYVEWARRAGEYNRMEGYANLLMQIIGKDVSPEASKIRSKLAYELHMGTYQQAIVSEGEEQTRLFEESLRFAEQSAIDAKFAGDPLGILFAKMNISGLLEKNIEKSTLVCHEAEVIATAASTTDEDRRRAWQITMNTYFHRIRITIERHGNKDCVSFWLNRVKVNPTFIGKKDETWALEAVAAAEKFIQG